MSWEALSRLDATCRPISGVRPVLEGRAAGGWRGRPIKRPAPPEHAYRARMLDVLGAFNDAGTDGATELEVVATTGIDEKTVSACRRGLLSDGLIQDSTRRLVTRIAGPVVVWVITAEGREMYR